MRGNIIVSGKNAAYMIVTKIHILYVMLMPMYVHGHGVIIIMATMITVYVQFIVYI